MPNNDKKIRNTNPKQQNKKLVCSPSLLHTFRAPVPKKLLAQTENIFSMCFLACGSFALGILFAFSPLSLIKFESTDIFGEDVVSLMQEHDDNSWNDTASDLSLLSQVENTEATSQDRDKKSLSQNENEKHKAPDIPNKKYDIEHVNAFIASVNSNLSPLDRQKVAIALVKYSNMYKVPLHIAVGVAHAESNFNLGSVGPGTSSGKALGPMQVMYSVHYALLSKYGIESAQALHDPDKGIKAGCLLLGRYIKSTGSVSAGLGKYLSKLSSDYILGKVMSSSLAFSSLKVGEISEQDIKQRIAEEKKVLAKLK
mgnify:CR=1 FL=1